MPIALVAYLNSFKNVLILRDFKGVALREGGSGKIIPQFAYLAVKLNLYERASEYKFVFTASSKGRYDFGTRGKAFPP